MQFVKILFWVLFLVASFIFWWSNEARTAIDIGAAIVEGRVSTFVIAAFLIGAVPLWLLNRTNHWRLSRRIKTLEAAARPAPAPSPAPQAAPQAAPQPAAQPAPAPVEPKAKPVQEPASMISPVSDGKAVDV